MDREQEKLQFLGVFGIFKESFKIIFTCRKVLSQITLSLILPLSFIFQAHIQISQFIFFNILNNEDSLYHTPQNTPKYDKLSDILLSQWTAFWLFKLAYFTFFLILSLLSTSAVVYTIACMYTSKDVTFRKVMSVIPKVWNRLMITFIWNFAILLAYNILAGILFLFWVAFIAPVSIEIVICMTLLILYSMGFVYIIIIWHLASVVSVLEESYGKEAMIKSKALLKGKMGIAIAVFLVLCICFLGTQLVFETCVVIGLEGLEVEARIGIGLLCFLFLFIVILFGLVIQTVFYFVCKSYHHENIDKSSVAYHLEVYLGECEPLKPRDVRLGDYGVLLQLLITCFLNKVPQ